MTVREDGSNELEHFTVVGELEARLVLTWISVNSPPGTALLDSRPGQTVDVETPDGPMQYEVLRIVGAPIRISIPVSAHDDAEPLVFGQVVEETAQTWPIR